MYKKIFYILNLILIISLIALFVNLQKSDEEIERIKVEIKGAVKKEGVYELDNDSRVIDLVKKSGGLTTQADISVLNMSKELRNQDVVIIYTKEEISEMKKGSTSIKYIEKECVCPKVENAACFDDIISNSESIINKTGKISLNTATINELLTLPGIGESKAKLIIEYRNQHSFKAIEEIMNVKGIGNGIFEKIKDYLTI